MKISIAFIAFAALAIKAAATELPITLTIQLTAPNTVTVSAYGGGMLAPWYVLESSTDLTQTNWVIVETNYYNISPVIFTKIPVTNSPEFFRVYAF